LLLVNKVNGAMKSFHTRIGTIATPDERETNMDVKAAAGAILLVASMSIGCSENARIFWEARIGKPASQVRGLEGISKGGTFIGNERIMVSMYPGQVPGTPEGRCYAVVVDGSGIIAAKGYLDLEGQDRFVLVMRRADLEEFRKVQEQLGVPPLGPEQIREEDPSVSPRYDGKGPGRSLPQNTRLASGVMAYSWVRLSDCLMGWPFARRSNDLRSYAAHGGEIPWDQFLAEAKDGTLNKGCRDDVVGIQGRSPSRCTVGGYLNLMGLRIEGTTEQQHPINWGD
jgi:hypothetical protein